MSKKSVGIFGDSYATVTMTAGPFTSKIWADVLAEEYEVVNYGRPGNSVYKCYKDFIEHGSKHDYNVMTVPTLDRFYSSALHNSSISEILNFENWYANYSNIILFGDIIKNKDVSDQSLKIFESLKTYYEYWKDDDFLSTVNDALVDKLKNCSNLLLIEVKPKDHFGLWNLSIWEIDVTRVNTSHNPVDAKNKRYLRDERNCHLSEENNIILGRIILDAIKNNKKIELKLEDFVIPTKNIDQYMKWVEYE
jgi:hypothetical protein